MATPGVPTPPHVEAAIIAALAAGQPKAAVPKAHGVHPKTVARLAKREANAKYLAERREQNRRETLAAVVPIAPMIWAEVKNELAKPKPDGRQIDALTRSGLNTEKVAASVSGENLPGKQPPAAVAIQILLPPWAGPVDPSATGAGVVIVQGSPTPPGPLKLPIAHEDEATGEHVNES